VIATLHPNHNYEKVVFDAWRQINYDVNDTVTASGVQTGDPRTDPDVAGYMREYFKNQPVTWQTWYQQRIGNPPGDPDRDAAQKAAAHAGTPGVTYFDTLGRPFLTIAHNKVACADHPRDGTEDMYYNRVELDIEGNQRAVIDAGGRVVMRYSYSMAGPEEDKEKAGNNRIHQASMEAGERWMLHDIVGNPIRSWDSRGFTCRMTFDRLRRPTGVYVTEQGTERLAERTIYGEGQGDVANHRTRVYQVCDGAGIINSVAYDFKGNLLESRRELLPYSNQPIDWLQNPAANDGSFTSRTRYDALNRPTQFIAPHGNQPGVKVNVIQSVYNEANLLEQVHTWLNRNAEPADRLDSATANLHAVMDINYNAKGQRVQIVYGNGTTTDYEYDPSTFRLKQLKTTRPANPDMTLSQLFQNATVVQDLRYSYDPLGNITRSHDAALKTVYNGQQIDSTGHYTYDALNRIIEASGREHTGQTAYDFNQPDRRDYPFVGHQAHLNDLQALRIYNEQYEYDAVGNFEALHHTANGGNWTRRYDYNEDSLIESGIKSNRLTRTRLGNGFNHVEPYTYDAHGNITSMPHLAQMDWDFKDQLYEVNMGGGGTARYVYDADGQRVRKVIERQNGTREKECIYLGNFEVYREYNGNGIDIKLERETLHMTDDQQRIALMETKTQDTSQPPVANPQALVRYQLGNHLDSASLELAADGALISYEEYYPYGATAFQAGPTAAELSLKRYRYTGKERDEESGLYYHGARYYAPWLGRWSSCEPDISRYLHYSPYIYVLNNPIRYTDEDGRSAKEKIMSYLEFGLQGIRFIVLAMIGGLAGAILGGVAGGLIGGFSGGPLWAVGGTLLGSLAGAALGLVTGAAYALLTWKWAREKIFGWIGSGLQSAAESVWGGMQKAWSGIKTAAGAVWSGMQKAWSGIKTAAGAVWSGMQKAWSGIKTTAGAVWSGMQKAWSGIKTTAGAVWGGMQKAWSGIKSAAGWLVEKIRSLFRDPDEATSRSPSTNPHQGGLSSKIEEVVKKKVSGHYIGPLIPGINALGGGMNPTGSVSDDNIHTRTTPAPSSEKGAVQVFEPGVGFGYSYSMFSYSRRSVFSLGFSPTSELVPYYPGGVSQPFSGPSAGFYFGVRLDIRWK
jgi:RHS repeat-associated protein